MNNDFVPECILQCKAHYVPPNKKYITCRDFGNPDGMNGGCHWCLEMTPYQWYMCSDESFLRSLTSEFCRLHKEGVKFDRISGAKYIERDKIERMKDRAIIDRP